MSTSTKTRKTRKPMTDVEREAAKAARAAKVAALESAAGSFELDENDRAMLAAFAALTEHYSEGNAMLILAQADQLGLKVTGPEDVGGFWVWKDRGRAVRKGEHQSIFIWQPAGSAAQADKAVDESAPTGATAEGDDTAKVRKFFKVGGLFHISQTDEVEAEKVIK